MKSSPFDLSQIVIIGCFAIAGDVFAAPGVLILFIPIVGLPIAAFLFMLSGFLSLVTAGIIFAKLYLTLPEIKSLAQNPAAGLDPIGSAVTVAPWVLLLLVCPVGIILPIKLFASMAIVALTNQGVQKAVKLAGNIALTVSTGGAGGLAEGAAAMAGKAALETAEKSAVSAVERTAVSAAEKTALTAERSAAGAGEAAGNAEGSFRRIEKAEEPKIPEPDKKTSAKRPEEADRSGSVDSAQQNDGVIDDSEDEEGAQEPEEESGSGREQSSP